jgi:hypothetical protein
MDIKTLINILISFSLKHRVEKISKLNIHNLETSRLEIKSRLFFLPGKYSIVCRNKFNDISIKYFHIEDACHLTIKEVFELSNISY